MNMQREDELIIKTAHTLELFDKYELPDWKKIYIETTKKLAKKYKLKFLLSFIESYEVSGMRFSEDG